MLSVHVSSTLLNEIEEFRLCKRLSEHPGIAHLHEECPVGLDQAKVIASERVITIPDEENDSGIYIEPLARPRVRMCTIHVLA